MTQKQEPEKNSEIETTNMITIDKIMILANNIMSREFLFYKVIAKETRRDYIASNLSLKIYYEQLNKNKQKKKNMYSLYQIKEITHLSKSIMTINSTYCYPTESCFLSENCYELKYVDSFKTFEEYDSVIKNVWTSIKNIYHFYSSEESTANKINNIYFLIWSFIQIILKLKNTSQIVCHFHSIFISGIIYCMSQLINKVVNHVYKPISLYVSYFINQIKRSKKQNLSLPTYNKNFCSICHLYLCHLHFYHICKEKEMNISTTRINSDDKEEKIIKSFKVYNKKWVKLSNERSFIVKHLHYLKEEGDCEPQFKCSDINNCEKTSSSSSLINFQENTKLNRELFYDLFTKEDFYVFNCLLSLELFTNPCYMAQVFNYKYHCVFLSKAMELCSAVSNHREIDIYLQTHNSYSSISRNILYINSIPEREQRRNYIVDPNNRINYIPCDHAGECSKDNCDCYKRGSCEKFCICAKRKCQLQYKGCNCVDGCQILNIDISQSKCSCISEGRECDPEVCLNCRCCKNMNLFFKHYKKTVIAKSVIVPDAIGLFAWEDIKQFDLIGEYKGEICEKKESDRRSYFNEILGRNYVFSCSDSYDIDAIRIGNQIRYINHSSFGYDNCFAENKFVRGIIKIALYAKRDILKGEELYFNYGMKELPWSIEYNKQYNPGNDRLYEIIYFDPEDD